MTDGSDGGFDPNTLTEFVAIWLPRVFLLSFGLPQKSLFARCFYLFFFESLSLNTQEGLHQKGKSKGDILQSILFFAQQSGKGGAKGKDWGSKEKGQGESSSGVPPPPPGDGAGAPPPPPPPPEETGAGGEGMSEPEPETRREPEAVGRVVHEPKQMPKTTAPKPAAPKQEEFAPKGGATKPPEPAKPPSTAIPTSAKLPGAGHFVSN